MSAWHICSFDTSVSELTRKQKRDPLMVLQCLKRNRRISTFEMSTDKLYETVDTMEARGWIKSVKEPYPYHRYRITKAGREAIAKSVIMI